MRTLRCLALKQPIKLFTCTYFIAGSSAYAGDLTNETKEYAEPIAIEETYPNSPGEYDLRVSLEYFKQSGEEEEGQSEGNINFYSVPKAQLFFGISERFGGEIELSYLIRDAEQADTDAGFGNIGLGLKYLFYENSKHDVAVVLGAEIEIPTASENKNLGEGKWEYEPFIAHLKQFNLGHALIDNIVWQGNVGYHFEHGEESFVYKQSLALPLAGNTTFFIEFFGNIATPSEENQSPAYFSPGIKYNINNEVFAALGVPIGLNAAADDHRVLMQFQFGF